jgi:hypothetical protein
MRLALLKRKRAPIQRTLLQAIVTELTAGQILMANIIEVKDLKNSFGDFEAVKGISFSVEQGKAFGFLGPNRFRTVSTVCTHSSSMSRILALRLT